MDSLPQNEKSSEAKESKVSEDMLIGFTKFGGSTFTLCKEENIPNLFTACGYISYEVYDPTKNYPEINDEVEYRFYVVDTGSGKHINYVVKAEALSEEKINMYAMYCQCGSCLESLWWKNIRYYLSIPSPCICCIGCLKSCMPGLHQLKKARKYVNDNGIAI